MDRECLGVFILDPLSLTLVSQPPQEPNYGYPLGGQICFDGLIMLPGEVPLDACVWLEEVIVTFHPLVVFPQVLVMPFDLVLEAGQFSLHADYGRGQVCRLNKMGNVLIALDNLSTVGLHLFGSSLSA